MNCLLLQSMSKIETIGILREGKVPPDTRVALTPQQARLVQDQFGVKILVQPSETRSFSDTEYRAQGLIVQEDLSGCDLLLGIKEVKIETLISNKTYLFFSHTIKKQPYNRKLLQTILAKNIRLIDYEVIKDEKDVRVIAFGFYAGLVGAHNGIALYGLKSRKFSLQQMKNFHHYADARDLYQETVWPNMRIAITGSGRVGKGAYTTLKDMGIHELSSEEYLLGKEYKYPVFTVLDATEYMTKKDGTAFDRTEFYAHPELYKSSFLPYAKVTDILINCIYYDPKASRFFEVEDMLSEDFRISVISDVTCDPMPNSSIPSTIHVSTIAEPYWGFDPATNSKVDFKIPNAIAMQTVDNLPNELPRDASQFFGTQLIENVLPKLIDNPHHPMIIGGTLTENGGLTQEFKYLEDYVN
jgi:saccharopine dehydrogenase (NAD+, L-lysine forming)